MLNNLARFYFSRSKRNNLIFDLPVAQRLTLGFLATALIATVLAGSISILQVQSLHRLSDFYQNLLQRKTTLILGEYELDQMNTALHTSLELVVMPDYSQESLRANQDALYRLSADYDHILSVYMRQDLLEHNPEQVSLLNEANHVSQVLQQRSLVESALRAWTACEQALREVLGDLARHDLFAAQNSTHLRLEPTMADALSSLRALTQFDSSLASSVLDSVKVEEHDQLRNTVIGIACACAGISVIGILISSALVYRLQQLRRVVRAINDGPSSERVRVIGRDEIADISSSVNAMLEIIATEKEGGTAGELRDQFIASVSHELRNPLTEVFGWLELLRDYQDKVDAQTQAKFINNAFYGCQELMLLIDNVLDSTHIGRAATPQLENVSVSQIVADVVEHMEPRKLQTHDLRVDIPKALEAWADPQYVRQVLRNLLSNAFKYSPAQTQVLVTATRVQDTEVPGKQCAMYICICVQDSGSGIPPSQVQHLFQKFKRLSGDLHGPVRGTGLGLYISKQLVEAMDGRIWVTSSGVPGEGSCFYFTLPEAGRMNSFYSEPQLPAESHTHAGA